MAEPTEGTNRPSLFGELQRRSVYKVGATYVVVAWLLTQVATQVFPFFDVPVWGVRLVVVLLIIGFPAAIILAWAFDVTPAGIRRAEEIGPGETAGTADRARQTATRISALVIVTLILGAGLWFSYREATTRRAATAANGAQSAPASPQSTAAEKRMAILPFKPLAAENRDPVLELGMADTLITKLSESRDIIVASLTSVRKYTALDQDPIAAGRELRVGSVLEGNVQRTADYLRVSVRLIDVANGASLWAATFNEKFTDVFSVQDTIAQKVAQALAGRLTADAQKRLSKRYTEDVAAYQLYLTGRFHWNKFTPPDQWKSIEYFAQAVAADPNYALAYFGIGDAYRALGMTGQGPPLELFPKAKTALSKALQIDDSLAEAHATLAVLQVFFDWDWAAAEQEARRAVTLDPKSGAAHVALAQVLSTVGRNDEALREAALGCELDRVSALNNARYGAFLYLARRYPEAIERLRQTVQLDPGLFITHYYLGKSYLELSKPGEALTELRKTEEVSRGNAEALGALGYFFGRTGDQAQARAALGRLQSLAANRYVSAYHIAIVYAGLGETDEAMNWLEKAFTQRDPRMSWLKAEPSWDALRGNPRFTELLRKLRFE